MTRTKLKHAIAEAERFLKRAKEIAIYDNVDEYKPGKEVAAVKRSSMDLTRALADLRRKD